MPDRSSEGRPTFDNLVGKRKLPKHIRHSVVSHQKHRKTEVVPKLKTATTIENLGTIVDQSESNNLTPLNPSKSSAESNSKSSKTKQLRPFQSQVLSSEKGLQFESPELLHPQMI